MGANKKVFMIVSAMLTILSLAIIIYVSISIKNYSKHSAILHAQSIAEAVRDGLTSHMVNGTMDKRFLFLNNMSKHQNVQNLRVLRSKTVIEQFGKGEFEEYAYDDIDKEVLSAGRAINRIYTTKEGYEMMRTTIPYIAVKYATPNCLSCHTTARAGDVLGVISMSLPMAEAQQVRTNLTLRIVAISILMLIFVIFITDRYIKPYIKLFDDLDEGISKAYQGDFSYHVSTNLSDEAGKVASRLNELSEIFRFKKTIEQDGDKDTIYRRLGHILTHSFGIENFAIMEIESKEKSRVVVYESTQQQFPDGVYYNNANNCRAYTTDSDVISTDFYKICETCFVQECEFLCLPFNISDESSLVLHIRTKDVEEIKRIQKIVPIITNYIELAEPVLETKTLMQALQESTLKDGLTSLYNRRFLDNYINELQLDKNIAMMMIDIDYFKMVNDTYGHNIGDNVLRSVSKVLLNSIKHDDYAVRYGGEEFLVILTDKSDDEIESIAKSIKDSVSTIEFSSLNEVFKKTLSIGYALFPTDDTNPWQVIKLADNALYEAKENGRDRIIKYTKKA